jgi:hypothetical protein
VVIAITSVITAVTTASASSTGTPNAQFYVSTTGSNHGSGTSSAPFATLQHALDLAGPGSTIHLEPGTYVGSAHTVYDGTPTAPISVVGPDTSSGPHDTVLYGTGHVLDIDNSWIDVSGFEVDGQHKLESQVPYPVAPVLLTPFKNQHQSLIAPDKLVYVGADTSGVTGVTLSDMFLQGAGGECVRVRNDASDVVIRDSTIQYCGLAANSSDPADPYHDGQGVSIGTSPKSTSEPDYADDQTHDVTVEHDDIATYGSECVAIEENAYDNTVGDDVCADNLETAAFGGSNLEIRGYDNTVTRTTLIYSLGANLKLAVDAGTYPSSGNTVVGNGFYNPGVGSAKGVSIDDQVGAATICENLVQGSTSGVSEATATGPCAGSVSPPTTTPPTTGTAPPPSTTPPTTAPPTTAPPTSTTTTTSPAPPVTTAPPGSVVPGQILNLSNWKLTLPTNAAGVPDEKPDAVEILQPALASFSDTYFHADPAGNGVTLMAPIDGATTTGSYYPRSELREMDGSQEASWSTTAGDNVMSVTESVDAVPAVKQQVVFAQVHGPSDDVFEAETRYSSATGFVLYVNHNGVQWGQDLADGYVLGTRFTLSVVATGGVIDVYYNGVLKVSQPIVSSGDYFKAGAYTQSNGCTEAGLSSSCTSGRVDDHAFGQVTIYALSASHT